MIWVALVLAILLSALVSAWMFRHIRSLSGASVAVSETGPNHAELARQISVLREQVEENRRLIGVFRQEANTRHDGQQRLNEEVRTGLQDAKDRGSKSLHLAGTLSGELIHGSKRFVTADEKRILLEQVAAPLGLDWVTERHLLYMEHAVPMLEARLRGRLAAPAAAMALRSLIVMAAPDPTRVLEIGTLYGLSACYLHEIVRPNKTGFHQTIIDPFFGYYGEDNPDIFTPIPVIEDVFRENMRRVGALDSELRVEVGLAEDESIRARMHDERFEVLIIDGDHSLDGVRRDFENYSDHVVPGGFVIIDDYMGPSWPDVTRYVDEAVFTDPRFEFVSGDLRTAVVRRRPD